MLDLLPFLSGKPAQNVIYRLRVSRRLADSNAQQVKIVRQIIEGLGGEIATPEEAREILALKGGDQVNF